MSQKKPFTPQDKARIASGAAKKNNGQVAKDSFPAKVQSTVDQKAGGTGGK